MLESLRQGAGNIHQLNLDGAFPEPALYRPRELYEELKFTPLYDAEHGQWGSMMSEGQELEGTYRYAPAQLLGVLVEAQFNPQGVWALYETLKASPLYDAQREQWNWAISKEQELERTDRLAHSQLLGILVEAQFDPEAARALYERLKTSPLYDSRHGQWNWYMFEGQELQNTGRPANAQLIGVLVEAQFDPEAARALYETLKASPLYVAEHRQWNEYMLKEQHLVNTHCYADAQLLGVLVEAQFNPVEAQALYEELKAGPLYDAQRQQWNFYMSQERQVESTGRTADAQLLGVLVEANLLSTLPRPLTEATPPLPITEDW